MSATTTERVVPEPVVIRDKWEGLGQMINVRVKIAGIYGYTTIILKQGESLAERVRDTRRKFKPVSR